MRHSLRLEISQLVEHLVDASLWHSWNSKCRDSLLEHGLCDHPVGNVGALVYLEPLERPRFSAAERFADRAKVYLVAAQESLKHAVVQVYVSNTWGSISGGRVNDLSILIGGHFVVIKSTTSFIVQILVAAARGTKCRLHHVSVPVVISDWSVGLLSL